VWRFAKVGRGFVRISLVREPDVITAAAKKIAARRDGDDDNNAT